MEKSFLKVLVLMITCYYCLEEAKFRCNGCKQIICKKCCRDSDLKYLYFNSFPEFPWKLICCTHCPVITFTPKVQSYYSKKPFLKPITSKTRELSGNPDLYYLTKVDDYAKVMRKYGLGHLCYGHLDYGVMVGTKKFLSKEEIDHLPKHMRRGGEYDHDSVKLLGHKLSSHDKAICKFHSISVE